MPSADSCGEPFLEKPIEGLLPVGCGAEAVFNFSWEKEITQYGSGDDGDDTDKRPSTVGTVIIPTRTLLSTAEHHPTTPSTVSIVSVTFNRSATRLPPRFTPSPENRHSSFQHLLRLHLNTFNQRLSMLEKNTLDMKESIRLMEEQQSHLSSQLVKLISIQSTGEKGEKVTELENSYTDMESRLSRLEGRLEILIDGFTALAQEMNKMKRARQISRSPQEKRALPSVTTVLALPLYSTPQTTVRITSTETAFTSRATVPKSIPTPGLPVNKPTSAPQRERKLKSAATTPSVKNTTQLKSVTRSSKSQASTRSAVKRKTTVSKPSTTTKSTSQATVKPETKRPDGRRSTATAKRVSQPSKSKPTQGKKEATITKFQLEPPSHKSNPAKREQANKKDSAASSKNSGRNKAFRSDAPVQVQEGRRTSDGDSKKSLKPHKGSSRQNEKKTVHSSSKFSRNTKNSHTVTTTKPTKATTAKKSSTTVKRKSTTPKTKTTTAKKVTKKRQQKKKKNPHSGVLDLLQLLNGDRKSAKPKKTREGSLHVVLGRLAIPIKIIPDD